MIAAPHTGVITVATHSDPPPAGTLSFLGVQQLNARPIRPRRGISTNPTVVAEIVKAIPEIAVNGPTDTG
jgi:hypothetical protein